MDSEYRNETPDEILPEESMKYCSNICSNICSNNNFLSGTIGVLIVISTFLAVTLGCGPAGSVFHTALDRFSKLIYQDSDLTDDAKKDSAQDSEAEQDDNDKSDSEKSASSSAEKSDNQVVDSGEAKEVIPPAENLVKDWEKPAFALFYSGNQQGYIEPCGCTGLENQKGGLIRRHSALMTLQSRGWDLIKIDSGDQIKRFGQQSMIKMEKTLEAITRVMKYDSVGLGLDDLKIPSIDLAQAMLNANLGTNPFVCANVEVLDPDLCRRFQILERGGKRIGITMILGDEYIAELGTIDGITTKQAQLGLAEVVPQMAAQKCDARILVAATSLDRCRELAKKFPDFDLLITTDCGGDPTLDPEEVETPRGKMPMVQVGAKAMYVGIVGFYFDATNKVKIRYERVPLDARFKDSEAVKEIFVDYQKQLKRLWLSGRFADIQPRPHPSDHKFLGSESCADCHGKEYEIWERGHDGEGGPHKHATASLTDPGERSWVQRHYDPECVSCHMTGWNPQGYFPYESGYVNHGKDIHLFDNGCENCHGPGSAHVAAEKEEKNEELMKKLRLEMRVTLDEARKNACVQCHDLDNSPDFLKEGGFDKYWPLIEH